MEKETEKKTERSTYVLESNKGTGSVKIANDVVAMIAGLAATEVDGVSAMVGNITNELMSKVGMKKQTPDNTELPPECQGSLPGTDYI